MNTGDFQTDVSLQLRIRIYMDVLGKIRRKSDRYCAQQIVAARQSFEAIGSRRIARRGPAGSAGARGQRERSPGNVMPLWVFHNSGDRSGLCQRGTDKKKQRISP